MSAPAVPFGDLAPLLAPRSVAVLGASDRDGNLGGVCIGFLRKFGYAGPIWPINPGRDEVGGLKCYPSLDALTSTPDLAILALPVDSVAQALRDCVAANVPAAVAWAGGFADAGEAGRAKQRELEEICRASGIRLCGPNCIGIINTSIGLTASFSSMMYDHDRLVPGVISMVSQSGGIGVMSHARAQEMGYGFRVTISCGNEAALGVPEFIRALAQDPGTRVIASYIEGLSDPAKLVDALAAARAAGKPVVMLKGGASEASGRAALAHTGRLGGLDRAYDAIFREFGVIRVYSTEELLDVCLQLASLRPGQLPAGDRMLISTFGGGSGVICTDQCIREGLQVPQLDAPTRERVAALLTPLSSALNPIDMTPGMMTNAKHRANMPAALAALGAAPGVDSWMFLAAGFGSLAPDLVDMLDEARRATDKPICIAWQAPPEGIHALLASRGINVFVEYARGVRAMGKIVRYATAIEEPIGKLDAPVATFDWQAHVDPSQKVQSEHVAAQILEQAGLPVARGRLARTADEAVKAAREVGYPVAIKGISPAITHRAAAGLVALDIGTDDAVRATEALFRERAAARGVTLDGVWVQHMFAGRAEMLVTAYRDREFGVLVGCGIGGGMTEVVDDVAFARAPIDAASARHLIGSLRTLKRLPDFLDGAARERLADWVARFSMLVASAPWPEFTFEVNPVKIGADGVAAVDGLLLIGA